MRNGIFKAFGWDMLGTLVGSITTFVTTMVLARILTPEDFGVIAIAMVFILLFNLVGEFGFKQALIQNQTITEKGYSSVFYLNVSIGIVISLLLFFTAPLIAEFYHIVELKLVIRLLSVTFVFNSLSLVQIAILSKELDFKSLSIRIIIARLCSSILGISLAINGYGVLALVWQEIAFSVLNSCLLWILSSWRPQLIFDKREVKLLTNFGGYLFLRQILHQSINRIDELVIGKLFSPTTLGFFGRSNSMSEMINGVSTKSINSFFFPLFSKIQHDGPLFTRTYNSVYQLIIIVSFYISGVAIILSETIIIGLFGSQWYGSVEIFEILMFKLATFPTSAFLVAALLSQGYAKENFYYGLVKSALRAVPFICAIFVGFKVFLYTLVVVSFIAVFYNNYINGKLLKISSFPQMATYIKNFVVFLILVGICKYMSFGASLFSVKIFLTAFGFTAMYAVIYFRTLNKIISKLKNDFRSKAGS